MIVAFDSDIAARYGVNAAVILNNLYGWIKYNEVNDKHYHEGRYWTYSSCKAFSDLFQFMTERQASLAIQTLVNEGILLKGNFNSMQYDRTLWYAFTDFGLSVVDGRVKTDTHEGAIQPTPASNSSNADVPFIQRPRETYTNNITIDKTVYKNNIYTPPNPPTGEDMSKKTKTHNENEDRFDRFWDAYPKHQAKQDAMKAFKKLNPDADTLEAMLKAIAAQKLTPDWQKDKGQFIPLPATWLRGRRWEDEIQGAASQQSPAVKPEPQKPTTVPPARPTEAPRPKPTKRQQREQIAEQLQYTQHISYHEALIRMGLRSPEWKAPTAADALQGRGKVREVCERNNRLDAEYEAQWLDEHPEWKE